VKVCTILKVLPVQEFGDIISDKKLGYHKQIAHQRQFETLASTVRKI